MRGGGRSPLNRCERKEPRRRNKDIPKAKRGALQMRARSGQEEGSETKG